MKTGWPHDAKFIGPNWEPIPDMPGHYIYTKEMPPLTRPTELINAVLMNTPKPAK